MSNPFDPNISRLAAFSADLRFNNLPAPTRLEALRRLLDTLGCGLAAHDHPHATITRNLALRARVATGATLLGSRIRVLPEFAAFANGTACRALEGNDVFPGGGHPSDCIPAVLAAAETVDADGATLITAIVAAYEVYANLYAAARVRDVGFDYVLYTAAGSAAGAARVMKLSTTITANALALAITANMGLAATRRGHVSIWKNVAGPNAARNGLFAALLARDGVTGPPSAIAGGHGLAEIAGRFDPPPLPDVDPAAGFAIERADIKSMLTEFHSQSPIIATTEVADQLNGEAIESVLVETYAFTMKELAGDREKWRPKTRESADHSLPYIVAATLIDGSFSEAIFAPERISDPRLEQLMDRVVVREDPSFTMKFPEKIPCRITVVAASGRQLVAQVDYPRGHHNNPLSDAELEAKFRGLAGRVLPARRVDHALNVLWTLDNASSLTTLVDALAIADQPQA